MPTMSAPWRSGETKEESLTKDGQTEDREARVDKAWKAPWQPNKTAESPSTASGPCGKLKVERTAQWMPRPTGTLKVGLRVQNHGHEGQDAAFPTKKTKQSP